MKFNLIIFCSLFACSSFCQQRSANIYDRITNQLCDCINKSKETDSVKKKSQCYESVLKNNYEELKRNGIDTTKNKDFKDHYDLYLRRYKKTNGSGQNEIVNSHDDSFVGSLVRQERLANGEYMILLRSSETKMEKSFLSADAVNEKELKKFRPGEDNIIFSYQTITENGKTIFRVKSIVYIGTRSQQ